MKSLLRIGTRGSMLALAQSRWVQAQLQAQHPQLSIELIVIKTSGDKFVDRPLSSLGGKGLFVKEIEEAMQAGDIDCAVHSLKDVPNELAPGLRLAAVPPRADARDVLIAATPGTRLSALPAQARVGTSSLRRMALLHALRPDLRVEPLRGNVDSRLRKVDAGDLDAIVLAAAGLQRLGIARPDAEDMNIEHFLPAVGQGALAIESRDDATVNWLMALEDPATRVAITAERAFLNSVGGSCRTPLAAYAELHGDRLRLRALIAHPDGSEIVRGERVAPSRDAEAIGTALGEDILARGGREILQGLEASDGG